MAEISSNSRRIAKNTMALYVRMLLSTVVSLYTSRVVLQTLGVEDFGVYGVVGGIVAMFSFLNSTMAGATSRFLSFELGKGDENRLKETFSSALSIHIGIALIVFVLAETIGMWFLCNKLVIPEGRMAAAHWVFQFSILSMIVSVTQVPYNAMIISHEKMNVYAYVELLHVFLKLGIVYLLVIGDFDKLILYAFLVLIVHIITAGIYRIYCLRHFEESHFHMIWKKDLLLPMLNFSGWDLFGNMSYSIRMQGTNFLLNMFFGTAINAASGIASTVQGVLLSFSSNVTTAFKPPIIKSLAKGNMQYFNNYIMFGAKLSGLLLFLPTIPLLLNMPLVINLWLGHIPEGTVIMCRISLIMNIFSLYSQFLISGVHATGNMKHLSFYCGCVSLVSLLIMYFSLRIGVGYSCIYCIILFVIICYMMIALFVLKSLIPSFCVEAFILKTVIPQICSGVIILILCQLFFHRTSTLTINHIILDVALSGLLLIVSTYLFLNKSEKKILHELIRRHK